MRPHGESGFTLLEMLVALSVLSIAVLALVNLAGESLRNQGVIDARAFANVVAENRAVEALTSLQPPEPGETKGTEAAAGRLWQWSRNVVATDEPDILRVDIAVRSQDSAQVLGAVTVFRGRR
jgi:general secretion pathway protein I